MRSRPKAPIFTSIVYHHHIPLFKRSSSSPMAISTIYYDWIMTHASEGQAKMRLSACSRCMRPAGVLAGSMEMHTRQIQIKVKTWIRPRRSQIRISCSRINTCSTVHIWFQFKESKDKLQSISCSRKRTHQLRDKSSQDVTKNHEITGERTRVFYVWCYSQSHNKLQKWVERW